jgi:hypothetical protein
LGCNRENADDPSDCNRTAIGGELDQRPIDDVAWKPPIANSGQGRA